MIPLIAAAEAQLDALATLADRPMPAAATLLGERAALNRFVVPGQQSAGGGCRLHAASDGHVALNLARPDDRALLPALFGDATLDPADDAAIAACLAGSGAAAIVARGRELGLAIASLDERTTAPACTVLSVGEPTLRSTGAPLVIDLAALWAGPLAAHLLGLAGGRVVKVESRTRPDSLRDGDPALFARLNGGKASVVLDWRVAHERDALLALLRRADIVIEAARPRALRQLGIDAEVLVREVPGLVWVTITGHGASGEPAHWTGFGDDCGVAGGLSAALLAATGTVGFVGDAIADPLTGIAAAQTAWARHRSGLGGRLGLSMAGIAAAALAAERRRDPRALDRSLEQWAASRGQPFPAVPSRPGLPVRAFGEDSGVWLAPRPPC